MTPEQLKASILQYAIQGKLVEQRSEEGTGEELYRQIQAEKQRLIQEKKIKKEKPLAEISEDEIPFDIPENWKWVKVGNVGSWSSGATPSRTTPAYYGGTIPWLKTGDLNDGFIKEVPEFITDLALEKTSVRLNPVGSVLMAMYGATIGKLGILDISATTNQACCACIPYEGIHNKYLFYYLMSMRRSYIGMAEGGAQPNISKEKIVNSLIPLPPLAEQKRIVAKIEELLPLVDRYAVAYEKLEQFNAKFPEDMKKSILQYAIQGKLVEQRPEEGTGEELYQQIQAKKQLLIAEKKIKKEKTLAEITEDEIPFDIPESWKWVRVGQCFANKTGLSYKKDALDSQSDRMVRVLRGGNISSLNYVLKPDDILISAKFVKSELYLQRNTIITPAVTSLEHIGKMGRIDSNYSDMVVGGFVLMLIPHYPEDTLAKYLLYAMSSQYFRDCCRNIVNKSGQAFYNLSREKLMRLCLPLPPLAEQKRIVAKIEELLPLCERLK